MLNTAFIERLNATFRERLASLTRKSRHTASRLHALHTGMYLIGCTYNFCVLHQELSKEKHWGKACTPALASGLTDHVWSFSELLSYKAAPPPWVEPKRRGRPPKQTGLPATPTKGRSRPASSRPLVRLRKGVLCLTTVSVALPVCSDHAFIWPLLASCSLYHQNPALLAFGRDSS